MTSNLEAKYMALQEAKASLDHQYESIEAVERTARTVLGSASLITSIIGALQLQFLEKGALEPIYFIVLGAYVPLILLCVWALQPIDVEIPIKADYEVYRDMMTHSEEELIRRLVATYLDVETKTFEMIKYRSYASSIASILLGIIVTLLILIPLL
jgi:hypothetical protein